MKTRILHFGKSIENYYLSINEKVVGFTLLFATEGDIVYFAVKANNVSLCGARAILFEPTKYNPWKIPKYFKSIFKVDKLEFCEPFDLKLLKEVGGKYYHLKYFQSSKSIDNIAKDILNNKFNSNKIDQLKSVEL